MGSLACPITRQGYQPRYPTMMGRALPGGTRESKQQNYSAEPRRTARGPDLRRPALTVRLSLVFDVPFCFTAYVDAAVEHSPHGPLLPHPTRRRVRKNAADATHVAPRERSPAPEKP